MVDQARQLVHDHQVPQQRIVRQGGLAADTSRVVDRLVLDYPSGVDCVSLQVALQPVGVGFRAEGAGIAQGDLVGIALEPCSGGAVAQHERRLRKPSSQSELQIRAKVDRRSRGAFQPIALRNAVDERTHGPMLLLGHSQGVHAQHDDPARKGPEPVGRVGAG